MHNNQPIIEIKNLTTSFSGKFGDNIIHDNLSLTFDCGKMHAIIGGSGAGKTVLLKSILGLIQYQKGEILFQGKRIEQETELEDLRKKTGIQFQNGALLSSLTVGENVMMPLIYKAGIAKEHASEIALGKLKLTGLSEEHFNKYPSMLSGGMIKRVSLARALALDPLILFVDEPTSGLDPISAQEYDHLISMLHSALGFTLIMITHDLLRVKNLASKIIVIHNKKAYSGTYEELAASEIVGKYVKDI